MKKNYFTLFGKFNSKDAKQEEEHEEEPPPSPAYYYTPFDPDHEEEVREWIREELMYMKQEEARPVEHKNEMDRWKDFKVSTDLSVPELSHFFKLLCDTGIIRNQNKTELMEFIATFFASTNTPNISGESLRKKFYNDSAAITNSVRDKLIKLLNQSKKRH